MIVVIRRVHPFCGAKKIHTPNIAFNNRLNLNLSLMCIRDSCSQHISTRWSSFRFFFVSSLQIALLHFTAHNHLLFWSNLFIHICQQNRHFGFQSFCLFRFFAFCLIKESIVKTKQKQNTNQRFESNGRRGPKTPCGLIEIICNLTLFAWFCRQSSKCCHNQLQPITTDPENKYDFSNCFNI